MVEILAHCDMSNSVFWLLMVEASLLYSFCIEAYYCGTAESSWKLTFGRGTKLIMKSGTS